DKGTLNAAFADIGVWRDPKGTGSSPYAAGWTDLSPAAATDLAVSADGKQLVASFVVYGLDYYNGGTSFTEISMLHTSTLGIDNIKDIAGIFEDGHLWYHAGSNPALGAFVLTSSLQATTLALSDQGLLVASFVGLGVNRFNGASYAQLSSFEARDLAFS